MTNRYLKLAFCTANNAYLAICILGVASASATTTPNNILASYHAVYAYKLGETSVDIIRTLETINGQYKLNLSVSSMLAGFNETSIFKIEKQRIKPIKYTYKGTGLNRRKSSNDFNWPKGIVRSFYKDKWYSLDIQHLSLIHI